MGINLEATKKNLNTPKHHNSLLRNIRQTVLKLSISWTLWYPGHVHGAISSHDPFFCVETLHKNSKILLRSWDRYLMLIQKACILFLKTQWLGGWFLKDICLTQRIILLLFQGICSDFRCVYVYGLYNFSVQNEYCLV